MRRLPGRHRGPIEQASLWDAGEYVLAVRSNRLSESYRRFYYRDIQAIVITRCPRFLVGTPVAVLTCLLGVATIPPATRWPSAAALGALAVLWLVVSLRFSCICRIHTAVSVETLMAVNRTWTATRFLAEVEPLVAAAQADLQVDTSAVPVRPAAPLAVAAHVPARSATLASTLFLAAILADAAATAVDLKSTQPRLEWLMHLLAVLEVAGAVAIFIQHSRGILGRAMVRVAIGMLVLIGAAFYAQALSAGVSVAQKQRPEPVNAVIRQVYIAGCVVLATTGVVVSLRRGGRQEVQ